MAAARFPRSRADRCPALSSGQSGGRCIQVLAHRQPLTARQGSLRPVRPTTASTRRRPIMGLAAIADRLDLTVGNGRGERGAPTPVRFRTAGGRPGLSRRSPDCRPPRWLASGLAPDCSSEHRPPPPLQPTAAHMAGVSQQTAWKWLRRFEIEGETGSQTGPRDRIARGQALKSHWLGGVPGGRRPAPQYDHDAEKAKRD